MERHWLTSEEAPQTGWACLTRRLLNASSRYQILIGVQLSKLLILWKHENHNLRNTKDSRDLMTLLSLMLTIQIIFSSI